MTRLVYLRMDESHRSSQNRSGKIFATSGVFIRGEPPNKKTTRQRDKTLLLLIYNYWSNKLRSIQAVFSCNCKRWVSRSAVGSSLAFSVLA